LGNTDGSGPNWRGNAMKTSLLALMKNQGHLPRLRDPFLLICSLAACIQPVKAGASGNFIAPFSGTMYVECVGGSAGAQSQFGTGTTPANFVPLLTGLPSSCPDAEVPVGSVTMGQTVQFAMSTFWQGQPYWTFSNASDQASLSSFTDVCNVLGLGGSVYQPTSDSTWVMHLLDAAHYSSGYSICLGSGFQPGQGDSNILIRLRIARPPLTFVSAATFEPIAAPDSLISIFGSGLATSTAQGELDSNGKLPTTLAGTMVTVRGQPAGLIFVSPSQINCVIPTAAAAGPGTISVITSGAQVGSGTLQIATVAPGLFSSDGTGIGDAVAVNGITGGGPPFPIQTQENPASDKRTRVILFGTGLRYAGNPTLSPTVTNVAGNLVVDALDVSGNPLSVQAEFAGPAPGFAGLDQINLVLPAEGGATADISIQIYAGSAGSNRLLIPTLQSACPVLTAVQPATVSPGADLMLNGTNFVTEDPTVPPTRTSVFLVLSSGDRITLPVTQTSPTGLTATVLPLQSNGSWYQGPAQVCVSVDGQQTCASAPIQIDGLKLLPSTPGSVLMAFQQKATAALQSYFTAAGLPAAASAVQARAQTDSSQLNAYIMAAINKAPLTLQQSDGTTVTVHPSLAVIETLEALLANSSYNSMSPHALEHPHALGTGPCASADEAKLESNRTISRFSGFRRQHSQPGGNCCCRRDAHRVHGRCGRVRPRGSRAVSDIDRDRSVSREAVDGGDSGLALRIECDAALPG
jgi:uncharacterized protein (TIGR03437 family)